MNAADHQSFRGPESPERYFQRLRYLQRDLNRLLLSQVRVHRVNGLLDPESACATEALFDTPHKIRDLFFSHNGEPSKPATEAVFYTDGDHLLAVARAVEPHMDGVRTLIPEGESAVRLPGTCMDYSPDKDDHIGFFFDGPCGHEFMSEVIITAANAREHRRWFCPSNNHPIVPRERLEWSPEYRTAAWRSNDEWRTALLIALDELDASESVVMGLNLSRHRHRDFGEESTWGSSIGSTARDPRQFGHLLMTDEAVAPTMVHFTSPYFGSNRLEFRFPPGVGCFDLVCRYESDDDKPEPGPRADPTESNVRQVTLSPDSESGVSLEIEVPSRACDGRFRITARRSGRACYEAAYPNTRNAGYVYEHRFADQYNEPAPDPSPNDPDFVAKKRDFIASRLPAFTRRNGMVIAAVDGSVEFPLLEEGAMERIATWISEKFKIREDRLIAATMVGSGPAFTNHSPESTSLEYLLTPLSTLRLGAGDCYARANVLAGLLSKMPAGDGGAFEAYPTLVLGHIITTVRCHRGWIPVDASFGHFYFRRDNRALATTEELAKDLEMVDRVDPRRRCEFRYPESHERFPLGRIVFPANAPPW